MNILVIFVSGIQIFTIMTEYIQRNIDSELSAWKEDSMRKPINNTTDDNSQLRGANGIMLFAPLTYVRISSV